MVPYVLPELRELFNWLEVEFHPLMLCNRVDGVLTFLEGSDIDLAQYIPSLQTNALVRLLKQVRLKVSQIDTQVSWSSCLES